MIEFKQGLVIREIFSRPGVKGFIIQVGEAEDKGIAYTELTGEINPGDQVLLNTTAVSLKLGSGGYHYIIAPMNRQEYTPLKPGGHIMKLRYTPQQLKVLSVEEEDSPYHEIMQKADSLDQIPVLVGTLHSMLAPLALLLAREGFRVGYVMTDGAALPVKFSQTVHLLRQQGVLVGTVAAGHAFGGDLEAVNIYSGLLAARHILRADVIIVTMGPGIVGTGTKWGFSGIEQGDILNATATLKGRGIAVPRISFGDRRLRHRGISHHTLTVLGQVTRMKALVPLPILEEEKQAYILEQIQQQNIGNRHEVSFWDGGSVFEVLSHPAYSFTTMGRSFEEEQEFYLALGAAVRAALPILIQLRDGFTG